jgi:hypothetical protein
MSLKVDYLREFANATFPHIMTAVQVDLLKKMKFLEPI